MTNDEISQAIYKLIDERFPDGMGTEFEEMIAAGKTHIVTRVDKIPVLAVASILDHAPV